MSILHLLFSILRYNFPHATSLRTRYTMRYTNLGRTGLKVSAIGLGCGNFGGIVSATVFNPVGDGPNDRGLSRRQIMRQVDASLRRLGVDYLDMYLIHEPDPSTPLDETLRALDDVVRQGKVRYIGASNMPAWLMTKALWISDKYLLHRFEWVQNSYSLLDRHDERELFPLCQDQGLGYTPFSPLAGGWLTGKYRAGQPFPAGSRMTLRPELYQQWLNERIFQGLDRLRAYAAER